MLDSQQPAGTKPEDLCAIFVHAGAGYHSHENEAKHLLACKHAVRAGMVFLRNGGTAVDAVEIAIASLEDTPITNSGYGSNLTADGKVEVDASIVDHFGRSGAVGAVPNVKNPIMLARKVYDQASRLPGLSRVPPNLLVGQGGTDFAERNGVTVVPDDLLITPSAKERWRSWTQEIADWDTRNPEGESDIFDSRQNIWIHDSTPPLDARVARTFGGQDARSKVKAELASMFKAVETSGADNEIGKFATPAQQSNGKSHQATCETSCWDANAQTKEYPSPNSCNDPRSSAPADGGDAITDTVGAIAVDRYGNIAAGSSSGGIGMKLRGRIGPAALIGIGTHVVPVDPADPDQTTVASVTSGTGEHIASTLAASVSANRVYYSKKAVGNGIFESVSEDEALQSMIDNEFSGHPALKNSEIKGSVGIMVVKKSKDGISLSFAHNTESFALASMSSNDVLPAAVMSRNSKRGSRGGSQVAQGGLMIRPRRHGTANPTTVKVKRTKKLKRFHSSQGS